MRTLGDVVGEINMGLAETGLTYPIYIAIPTSGDALATIMCPLDPSDDEWRQIDNIVCHVIGERIGSTRLTAREIPSAAVGDKGAPPT
jgi:hypothetical protein